MTRLFVTATGTEIGKTFVTAALVHAARQAGKSVRALKPVVSGFDPDDWIDADPAVLLAAQGLGEDALEKISPWRFLAPLSPDMAARREGRAVPFQDLVAFSQRGVAGSEDLVLIEGIGGVMVPLDDDHTVLDWIAAAGIEAVLVAGSYLGTLSHTLTAERALTSAGVRLRAIVVSESPDAPPLDETCRVIAHWTGVDVIALPRLRGWRDAAYPLASLIA